MILLLKVEGEKNYHLRIAAILGDVEAEVCCIFCYFQNVAFIHSANTSMFLNLILSLDGFGKATQGICTSCDSDRKLLRKNSVLLSRSKFTMDNFDS